MNYMNGAKNGDKVVVMLSPTHNRVRAEKSLAIRQEGVIQDIILCDEDGRGYNSAYLHTEGEREILIEKGEGSMSIFRIDSIEVVA